MKKKKKNSTLLLLSMKCYVLFKKNNNNTLFVKLQEAQKELDYTFKISIQCNSSYDPNHYNKT